MPSKISDIVIKMEDVGMKIDGSLHRENEENIGEISRRGRRQPQSFSRPSRTTRTENQSSACGNRKAAIQGEGEEEEEVTQKARTIKRKSTKLWASKEESEGGWRDNLENGRSFSMQMAGRYGYDSGSSRGKSNDGRYEKESKKMKMDSSTSFLSIESDGNLLLDDETEQLKDEVEEKKKLISSLKSRPWRMSKKLKCWKDAQQFLEKFERYLGKGKGHKFYAFTVNVSKKWKKLNRDFENFKAACIPWESKIKKVESHFGSSVASYFIFLRWLYGMNLVIFGFVVALVILPEILMGAPYGTIPRKTVPTSEKANAMDMTVLLEFDGYLKYSPLFYGYYDNQRTIGFMHFRLPLAYFLVGIAIFGYSLICLVRSMASNSHVTGDGVEERDFLFSWKLFTSWDYLVGNSETADSKFAAIATSIKESIVEVMETTKCENIYARRCLRVLANFLIISCLTGSGYLIYYVVKRSIKFSTMDDSKVTWMEKFEVQLVVSVLAIVCPPLFEGIAEMEEYHPRVALKWQLWRLFALFLANLYSLVLALYTEVNKKIQEEKALKNTTMWALKDFYGNSTELENGTAGLEFPVHPGDVPRGYCWESALGIEFMKLAISDIQVTYMTIFIADFLRAVAVRFLNYCWCWDLEMAFPSYAEFDISGNVLTLVFSQGMIWVGAFFSPGLLGINVLRLVSALYFQTWAVMCCNIPHKKVFKISKSNNFYMGLLLLLLFLSVLPVVYAIMTFPPSSDCGPFSGKEKIYDVITETIEQDFPAFWTTVFGYAVSPGVMILVLLLLALIIYYLKSVLKSYRKANEELRRRLQMQKDEERKQRNNIDSTNHLMDDLEELLPKRTHVPLSTKESIEEMTGNSLKLSQESETVLNERQGRFQNAVTRAPGPRVPGPLPGMALPQIVSPGSGRGRGQVIRWY